MNLHDTHCLASRSRQTQESRLSFTTCSTASNIRGPGRTIGNLISLLGRKLDNVVDSMPKSFGAMTEALFFPKVKVLLLGSADSGKLDIVEHVRTTYSGPQNVTQLASFRRLVYDHIRHEMLLLLESLELNGGCVSEDNVFNAQHVKGADNIYPDEPFPTMLYAALSYLWDDPGIQATWEQTNRHNLPYFYSSLDRFFSADYVPTYRDITQVASAKGEMPETNFRIPGAEITLVDAGLHLEPPHLSDVTCILYVVNLAGDDKSLCRNYSPMHRDKVIWKSLCRSERYQKTPLLLILNVPNVRQTVGPNTKAASPDYNGTPNDVFAVVQYMKIAKRYQKPKRRKIFVHIANFSVDSSWRFVLRKMEDIIVATAVDKACGR